MEFLELLCMITYKWVISDEPNLLTGAFSVNINPILLLG
jgi:hypothetical protein